MIRELLEKARKGPWKIGGYEYAEVNPFIVTDDENKYYVAFTRGIMGHAQFGKDNAALIVALHNCANELLKVAECSEGIVTLSRPYRLNDEGCRAAMEELLLKIKTLDAALRALREKESSCREER